MQSPPWSDAIHIGNNVFDINRVLHDIYLVICSAGAVILDIETSALYYIDAEPRMCNRDMWFSSMSPDTGGVTVIGGIHCLDGVAMHYCTFVEKTRVFILSRDTQWVVIRQRKYS